MSERDTQFEVAKALYTAGEGEIPGHQCFDLAERFVFIENTIIIREALYRNRNIKRSGLWAWPDGHPLIDHFWLS